MGMVLKMKREFKFDMDIILRNCERFGVKVEKGEGITGVTMNGKPFSVTREIKDAFNELNSASDLVINNTVTSTDVQIQNVFQNQKKRSIEVSMGKSNIMMPEQVSFSKENASLNAA